MIEYYIPYGHEKAITYDDLVFTTGMSPRRIRKEIAESDAVILNLQDGKGFFRFDPHTEAEVAFAKKYSAQEKSRGWSCIKKALKVDRAIKKADASVFNGNVYRLARLLKGETIENTAEALNCSVRRYRRIEDGLVDMSDTEIEAFEEFVGLSVREV